MNTQNLERQATEQRNKVERTTHELLDKVSHTTLSYNVRKHFGTIAIIASAIGFLSGYRVTVSFRR